MRRRINRTLLTATAASASLISLSFMAAGGAGAATTAGPVNGAFGGAPIVTDTTCAVTVTSPVGGLPSDNCARAGYQASGRDFRYAAASVVVPNHLGAVHNFAATTGSTPTPAVAGDASMYVALDDSGDVYDFARVGIMPTCSALSTLVANTCTTGGGTVSGYLSTWSVFAKVAVSGPGASAYTTFSAPLPVQDQGHGISVSAYLLPSSNWVRFVITTPTVPATTSVVGVTGQSYTRTFAVSSPAYTDAQAVADWSSAYLTSTGTINPVPPTTANVNAYDQFFQGRFTTWSGVKGTFNGKWTVNPIEATTDGTSATTVVTGPSYLWSNDKFPNDAFGVWIHGGTAA
jgi:hypothetical protein